MKEKLVIFKMIKHGSNGDKFLVATNYEFPPIIIEPKHRLIGVAVELHKKL